MSFFESQIPVPVCLPRYGQVLSRAELRQNLIEALLECEQHGYSAQDLIPEQFTQVNSQDPMAALRIFISDVLVSDKPMFVVYCYALAHGVGEMLGVTLQQVATRFGVRKQYVDKECKLIRDRAGMSGSWNSKAARENYSPRNWRNG